MFVCLKARVKGVQIHIWLMRLPTTHEYAYVFYINSISNYLLPKIFYAM